MLLCLYIIRTFIGWRSLKIRHFGSRLVLYYHNTAWYSVIEIGILNMHKPEGRDKMSIPGITTQFQNLAMNNSARTENLEDLGKTLSDIKNFESGKAVDSVSISAPNPVEVPLKAGAASILGFLTGFAKGKQEEVSDLTRVKEKETKNVAKLESELKKLEKKNSEAVYPLLKTALNNVEILSGTAGLLALGGAFAMFSTPLCFPLLIVGLNCTGFTAMYLMAKCN